MAHNLRNMLFLGAAAVGLASAAVKTTPPKAIATGSMIETRSRHAVAEKRQDAPTNCVYIEGASSSWHTECRVNAPAFGGGSVTQLLTSSVFGLPNGGVVTQTITTTAEISIALPTATDQPWKINMTPELRQKIIDTANECADKAKIRKVKRVGGGLIFDWNAMDVGYRGGCLRTIETVIGDAGIMVVDPVGRYFPDYSKLVPGKMVEKVDKVLHDTNDVLVEIDIPLEGMPTLSKGDGTKSTALSATTTFFPSGKPGGTKTTSAATPTASDDEDDEDGQDEEDEHGPACPTDAVIDPNDDQGQDGLPPKFCQHGANPDKRGLFKRSPPGSHYCNCQDGMVYMTSIATSTTEIDGSLTTYQDLCPYTNVPDSSLRIDPPPTPTFAYTPSPTAGGMVALSSPTCHPDNANFIGFETGDVKKAISSYCSEAYRRGYASPTPRPPKNRKGLGPAPKLADGKIQQDYKAAAFPQGYKVRIQVTADARACDKGSLGKAEGLTVDEGQWCIDQFQMILDRCPTYKRGPLDNLKDYIPGGIENFGCMSMEITHGDDPK